MKFRLTCLAMALVAAVAFVSAEQNDAARTLMESARKKEVVDGDLKGAIRQYQSIAEKYKGDHAVAADALVRLAACYEKLGDAEARKVYERIARDYADQKDAVVLAESRLKSGARAAQAGGTTFRKVWAGVEVDAEGTVSRDGRYISFPDWASGDLALHDLATGQNRRLTRHDELPGRYVEYAEESAISPDGAQVAYSWFNGKDRYEVRVLPTASTGLAQPRRLLDNEEISWIAPSDWSANGKWIAAQFNRKDRTAHIGLVSVQDGSLRVLKSIDWRGVTRIFFSPDSGYIAYDLPVSETNSSERDVFVLAIDGSHEAPVVAHAGHDRVMGWSPDGKWLLFASDRTGTLGLWGVPIANGRAAGAAVQMKQDIAPLSVGTTASGTLFVVGGLGSVDVQLSSVDLSAGKLVADANGLGGLVGSNAQPDWSTDGKRLLYVSTRSARGRDRVVVIRAVDTGESREVPLKMTYFGPPHWTPDGRAFLVKGTDLKGRHGIYRADALTGALTLLASPEDTGAGMPQLSPDGAKLYYWNGTALNGTPGSEFIENNLVSGRERIVFRDSGPVWPWLSPDGRYLAGITEIDHTPFSTLVLIDLISGERKELLRAASPQVLLNGTNSSWTPDSQHLIVARQDKSGREDLIVPINGGATRRLDLGTQKVRGPVKIHPDGRRIAFAAGESKGEVWMLENFLPATAAGQPATKR